MKRLFLTLLFLSLIFQTAGAQNRSKIFGTVVDETGQPVIQAGVQLLAGKDSVMVEGVVTDLDGKFTIVSQPGDYIVKISFIGYQDHFLNIHQTASQNGLGLGSIALTPKNLVLESAVVAVKVEPVTIKEDTVVYNAAAFRVAEDAMLEDLLKKIPGLEVDKNNNVTLHGREIKQLLVNGKKYFGGDVKSGLKNLSADMIENIRAYERESDFSRLTGIDDGEQEPVLDLSIKKSMMNGFRGNVNAGAGLQGRYAGRLNINKITKKDQITGIGNIRNTPGKASITNTSRTQLGNGSMGDAWNSEAGVTFARDRDTLDMGGHLHFSGQNRFADSEGRSQTINATSTSYGNSKSSTHSLHDVFKGDYSVEWRPKKNWTILVKPTFNYDISNTYSASRGRSFKSDPYALGDPSKYLEFDMPDDPFTSIRVNGTDNKYQNCTNYWNAGVNFQATFRSNLKKGRSITGRVYWTGRRTRQDNAYNYLTRYYKYQTTDKYGNPNPKAYTSRKNYIDTDIMASTWQWQLSWNEPIGKGMYLQFTYRPESRTQDQVKDYYDLTTAFPDWDVTTEMGREAVMRSLPQGYEDTRSELFSGKGRYESFSHNIFLTYRYVYKKKLNMSVGLTVRPQVTKLYYHDKDEDVDKVSRQSLVNFAPNAQIRYNKTKNQRLQLNYRSWSNSPSISQMLPITNGTNPLNILRGNPDLLPPYVHNVSIEYNSSNIKKQNSFIAIVTGIVTQNQVSTSSEYDPETGVRTSTPRNIDGNWKILGSMAYNQTLPDNHFSLNNHLSAEYQNNVSYLYNSSKKEDEVNLMTRFMAKERFEGCYRNDWLELILFGGVEYTNEASALRPELTQNPLLGSTGASVIVTFPWKMRLESDYSILFQRGFSYEELNRNYQVFNAELSQSVLKGKGTIRLGWYDIFNDQDNLIRSFGGSSRSINIYNGLTSYIMLRFIYRFKIG